MYVCMYVYQRCIQSDETKSRAYVYMCIRKLKNELLKRHDLYVYKFSALTSFRATQNSPKKAMCI